MNDFCSGNDCSVQEQDETTRLWQSYRGGDDSALEGIVRLLRDDLLYFVNGYLHNITAAEDTVSEAFLRLIMSREKFRGDSSLKTYLYRIAANLALDELRRQSRQKNVPIENAEEYAADEEELVSLVLRDERRAILHSALGKLNPDYRAVLFLVYFQNLSCDSAAAVLRKNRKQTENLLFRAKAALKTILQKEGYNYENL